MATLAQIQGRGLLAARPAAGSSGLVTNAVYFGTDTGLEYQYDGTSWQTNTPAGGAPSGAAGGDLTGTYPNPTVPGLATKEPGLGNPATGGFVLSSTVAGARSWIAPAAGGGLTNPMTTPQDIIVGGAAGAPARLGVGGANQVLTVVGGVLTWVTPAAGGGGLANPMTAVGDLIVGGGVVAVNVLLASNTVTATQSAAGAGRTAAGLIDGNDPASAYVAGSLAATDWYDNGGAAPNWAQFQFTGTQYAVASLRVIQHTNANFRASDYVVQSSPDGTTWTTRFGPSGAQDSGTIALAAAVTAAYWRIYSPTVGQWSVQIMELYTSSTAGAPVRIGVGANGTVPVADSTATNGIAYATPLNALAAQTVGTTQVTVAHGLGYVPSIVLHEMTSVGQIWRSAAPDATNCYFTADAAGRTCIPYVR